MTEKYRILDHNGWLKLLVVQRKYDPEANGGAGGYEDVIAIKDHRSSERNDSNQSASRVAGQSNLFCNQKHQTVLNQAGS